MNVYSNVLYDWAGMVMPKFWLSTSKTSRTEHTKPAKYANKEREQLILNELQSYAISINYKGKIPPFAELWTLERNEVHHQQNAC